MRDTLTCITTQQLEPLYFRKGAEEGKRYTVDEVNFSYRNGNALSTSNVPYMVKQIKSMMKCLCVFTTC